MVVLGVVLRFVQEARADDAAAKLKAMISVTATVIRDGQPREVPLGQLVPGDVVHLAAGDMIPADLRLALLQGPVRHPGEPHRRVAARREVRRPGDAGRPGSPLELKNICFLGTSVESGTATGVVVATGLDTYLGSMASAIVGQQVQTSFDQGRRPGSPG